MGPKHWLYHQSIFWIQVTILLGIAELVSSCQRSVTEKNAKTFFGQLTPEKKSEPRNVRSPETSPPAKGVEFQSKGVELPTFFPPPATDHFQIPVRLAGENVTLEQLADRLTLALNVAGYEGKCSYYWLEDLHGPGLAIVTHIEHIQPDGKPYLPSLSLSILEVAS